ncbi:hypothetical protein BDR03DRAFT_964613 [Suillus americanus]|nr:hypothetical protein BDR03DRAFT_964613 [Suillus americanus]
MRVRKLSIWWVVYGMCQGRWSDPIAVSPAQPAVRKHAAALISKPNKQRVPVGIMCCGWKPRESDDDNKDVP